MLMISNFRQSVALGVLKAVKNQTVFPVIHSFMLVPNFGESPDLFYSADKISMSALDIVNVYQLTPSHPQFENSISKALVSSETNNLITAPGSQLLAARTDLEIQSPTKAYARLQIVLSLKPQTSPFVEENEKVKFETLVIPTLPNGIRPVAVLDFRIDLSQGAQKKPELIVQLGELQSFGAGEFIIKVENRKTSVPRLEGRANKSGTKFVAVTIGFENLKFDLETMNLSEINTVTRAGIRIGSSQFVVGGFRLESVDQEFQKEINSKIDAEVEAAKKTSADAIEIKLISLELMNELLERILK